MTYRVRTLGEGDEGVVSVFSASRLHAHATRAGDSLSENAVDAPNLHKEGRAQ